MFALLHGQYFERDYPHSKVLLSWDEGLLRFELKSSKDWAEERL